MSEPAPLPDDEFGPLLQNPRTMTPAGRPARHRPMRAVAVAVAVVALLASCGARPSSPGSSGSEVATDEPSAIPAVDWRNPTAPVEDRVEALLAEMTLDEKIGQMTQIEKDSIDPATSPTLAARLRPERRRRYPVPNDPAGLVRDGRRVPAGRARRPASGIPILYGVDAVHGHNNVVGATIFPHNVGLGADATTRRSSSRSAGRRRVEMTATGIRWDFGPVVAVPQDVRWGRTYEGYGEDPTS